MYDNTNMPPDFDDYIMPTTWDKPKNKGGIMEYNPETYETVKERKAKFYKDYPDGRIIVDLLNPEAIMEQALYKAYLYCNREDQIEGLPRGTGTALEIRDKELSVSKQGKQYASVNYTSWTENAEESAIGRALDNAGYSGNKKCSREEMQKAEHHEKILTPNQTQHWCSKHNVAFRKTKRGNYAHKTDEGWCNEEDQVAEDTKGIQACEGCGTFDENLSDHNGRFLCDDCTSTPE